MEKATITIVFYLVFGIFNAAVAQQFKEKTLQTSIKEVTVFLSGAQVMESGQTAIPSGNTALIITGLSSFVNDNSVQIKGEGNFTVLSVNTRKNYLTKTKQDYKIDSLEKALEKVVSKIDSDNARKEVLAEKMSLLNQNKNLGNNSNVSLVLLKQAIDFYELETTKIKKEEIELKKRSEADRIERNQLEKQLETLRKKDKLPANEVVVRVSATQQTTGKFILTYMVGNAGWYPKYDIRLDDIEKPLNMIYKAEVYQNTGIDWKDVKLRFSNGDPSQSSVSPELNPWKLNYARNTVFQRNTRQFVPSGMVVGVVYDEQNNPLPGASITIPRTSVGTQTDFDGRYTLTLPRGAEQLQFSYIGMETQTVSITGSEINIRMKESSSTLEEVVVTGYSSKREKRSSGYLTNSIDAETITTSVVENQTTVEIEVDKPYSIASGGEKLMVDLKNYDIPAEYNYIAVPKLDKDAFLMARITDWGKYSLLEGEANLYFEKSFVGRTVLDANTLSDTLEISLGRDKNILVQREKQEEFTKRRTLGTNKIETRGFKITVRNKKSSTINLTIYDQLPVSVISEITVTPNNLDNAKFDTQTGELKWQFTLPSQQQKELLFGFEVKYPKKEKVILE
jgi:hypothetical protein